MRLVLFILGGLLSAQVYAGIGTVTDSSGVAVIKRGSSTIAVADISLINKGVVHEIAVCRL